MNDIRERCIMVISNVMEVDAASINDDTNPDNLEPWDSLAHVQLVLGLEEEFYTKISPEDGIEHFTGFKEIVDFIGVNHVSAAR